MAVQIDHHHLHTDTPCSSKAQQIKKGLIEKAKIRKEYAKVKARNPDLSTNNNNDSSSLYPAADADQDGDDDNAAAAKPEPSVERHPDRTQMIDDTPEEPELVESNPDSYQSRHQRQRRPKPVPFAREHAQAQQRKQEAEERRAAREEAERQRQQKLQERDRFRRAMAKARTGGKNGQRKLGRESNVLLEKVKRMVAETS